MTVRYTGPAWFSPMECFRADVDLEGNSWVLVDRRDFAVAGHVTDRGGYIVFKCENLEFIS
jgi:hypothetical protein